MKVLERLKRSTREEAGEFGYSSFFIEVSFADRVTIGASWMADEVETEMTERTDIAPGYMLLMADIARVLQEHTGCRFCVIQELVLLKQNLVI